MSDIRYVCLSDMHLGAQNSLLTNLRPDNLDADPLTPSPVLQALVECLQTAIRANNGPMKPTLVLGGDVLELALASDNIAAMAFERFIELICGPDGDPLFNEIIYIPGNHDHHLWETARETQYANYLKCGKQPTGTFLDIPWHATSMFQPNPVPSTFINAIISRYPNLGIENIGTVYPNYALLTGDHRRCVIFTHGHFAESLYLLMSRSRSLMFPSGRKPELTWDLEAENFAWIDFFWSTMGRSGDVGADVEIVYDKLQDKTQLGLLIKNLANGLGKKSGRAGWKNWVDAKLLKRVLDLVLFAASSAERTQTEDYLTPDAQQGLRDYLEGPVLKQIKVERNENIPPIVSLIFGHTHKPFESKMNFKGFEPGVSVYNTGGWVIDDVKPHPLVGGAVLLIDELMNVASVRMYNETTDRSASRITVSTAERENNILYDRLTKLVDPSANPWKRFAEVTVAEIPRRVANLENKIKQW